MRDFHSHSNYSDGQVLWAMVDAAQEAGLDGVGIADHCWLAPNDAARDDRAALGFTLDETYERRRRGIERVRQEAAIPIYDAVEMDYYPAQADRIAAFLDAADFDYVIGSVHGIDGRNLQFPAHFADDSAAELDAVVDEYFDRLVAMIDSELFDVAAHPDVVERNPHLAGRATAEHYERVAAALADSRTVPEVNAGRVLQDDGPLHPGEDFFEVLGEYDVAFTVGTDAHNPDEYGPRIDFLASFFDEHDVEPVAPPGL